ncbi:hypothetical protein [Blautia sp. LMAG:75]|uniref:hypothetical protein n=1 Tax=Blautia sp. LMAG:75 TaxID=1969171 RepID=UPI0025C1A728|nr:hypothetical protein [Blautia sp. LMAG:75]
MDKRWIQKGDIHILLYTPYYNEEEFARIMWDSDREWICYSEPLQMEQTILDADTLDEAKEEIEQMARDLCVDEIAHYERLLNIFEEGRP